MVQGTTNSPDNRGSFDLTDVLKILYQALLQSIDDPFRILDRDYRLLWVNKREPGHKLGHICYQTVFDRSDPCPECPVTTTFETGKPATFDRFIQYPDGSESWREIRAYPVFDTNSNIAYAITIGHDYGDERMELTQQQKRIETLENALYEIVQSKADQFPDVKTKRLKADLTKRELQVLRLISEGLTNIDISGVLSISPHTVKTHVIHVFNKLGVSDRAQAAALATRLKLI